MIVYPIFRTLYSCSTLLLDESLGADILLVQSHQVPTITTRPSLKPSGTTHLNCLVFRRGGIGWNWKNFSLSVERKLRFYHPRLHSPLITNWNHHFRWMPRGISAYHHPLTPTQQNPAVPFLSLRTTHLPRPVSPLQLYQPLLPRPPLRRCMTWVSYLTWVFLRTLATLTFDVLSITAEFRIVILHDQWRCCKGFFATMTTPALPRRSLDCQNQRKPPLFFSLKTGDSRLATKHRQLIIVTVYPLIRAWATIGQLSCPFTNLPII